MRAASDFAAAAELYDDLFELFDDLLTAEELAVEEELDHPEARASSSSSEDESEESEELSESDPAVHYCCFRTPQSIPPYHTHLQDYE